VQGEWFGQLMYDLVHPEDADKLREQLCMSDPASAGRVLDLKSMFETWLFCDRVKFAWSTLCLARKRL
jgi:hypothetical protein